MDRSRIHGLEALIRAVDGRNYPPVEAWNPPYCGDIGLHIAADGRWFYQGSEIRRLSLVQLFSRVLRRDDDGRHYLVTPVEKIDIKVDDVPFLAVEMDVQGENEAQTLVFRTNVDDIVRCSMERPLSFRPQGVSGGHKPYVRVRGRLEALITRALYYDLVDLAIAGEPGDAGYGIWSGGTFFPLPD